jgi:uncharacterized protein (DUF488 family)
MAEPQPPRVFTIGHSNQTFEQFAALLQAQQIALLVDVRSQPYSRYTPQFNGPALKAALPACGVQYRFLGRELGGMPEDREFYDADGRVSYARLAESPAFKKGLAQLEQIIGAQRTAVMCGEENPAECHRKLLIGRVLAEHGVEVVHIRGDGRVQSDAELEREQREARDGGQMMLFGDLEKKEWTSTRSVSPEKLRPNSSAR